MKCFIFLVVRNFPLIVNPALGGKKIVQIKIYVNFNQWNVLNLRASVEMIEV